LVRALRRKQLPEDQTMQRGAAMPVTVPCPSCGAKLRIPDTAVGKRVKCSKCATAFTAEPPAEPPAQPPAPKPQPAAVRAKPRKPAPPPEEPPIEDPEPIEEPEPVAIRAKPRKPAPPPEDEEEDLEEEEEVERRIRRRPANDGGISSLIPYKNGRALAAYYCGVFSLIPCLGLILGPIALIFGILGLRFGKEYPTAGGKGHAIAGIVLGLITTIGNWGGALFVVIITVIGMATNK
jgi:predicted Zn finger-like uncharacterized protein